MFCAWFDDLEIRHKGAIIAQETHYDPWGLELVGIGRQGLNRFTFNGQSEKQANLADGKGYFYETDFRSYDATLGRFHAYDLMASAYDAITPYHFALNNPISLNDPTGLWVSEKPAPVKPNSREPGSSSEPSAGSAGDSNPKKPTPVEPIDPLKQAVAAANIERPNERGRFGDGLVKHDVKCPICGKASCNHEPYEKALKASALMLAIPTKTPTWQGKVLTGIVAVAVVGVTWGYYRWYSGTKPEAIDVPIDIAIPKNKEPEYVTIYKAPQKGMGQKILLEGFNQETVPFEPPYLSGETYFAAQGHRNMAEAYARSYGDGIL